MKKFLLLAATISLMSCVSVNIVDDTEEDRVSNKGKQVKEVAVAPFHSLNCTGVCSYEFIPSATSRVVITAPEEFLDDVKVENKDGVLKLDVKRKRKINRRISIRVYGPEITTLNYSGVGDFEVKRKFKIDHLQITHKGVGDLSFDSLYCQNLKLNTSGTGDVRLKGQAETATCQMKGVGNVVLREMLVDSMKVDHSGVGDLSCYASNSIDIKSKGVGNVTYYGDPKITSLSKSGVGELKKR